MVHYINDTLADMEKFDTNDYSFATHAKHWAEMKGFALGLQFNPHSPLQTGTLFADLHNHMGDAPVLENATAQEIADYKAALESARELIRTAYGFAEANANNW